jgi:hypothetical protein
MRQYFGRNAVGLSLGNLSLPGLDGVPLLVEALRMLPVEKEPETPLRSAAERFSTSDSLDVTKVEDCPLADVLKLLFSQAELKVVIDNAEAFPFVDTAGQAVAITDRWEEKSLVEMIERVLADHELEAHLDPTNRIFHVRPVTYSLPQIHSHFDSFEEWLPQFDEAMRRPGAAYIDDSDIEQPMYGSSIRNLRTLGLGLANRSLVRALLGREGEALQDLHRLRQLMDIAISRQPPTVIGSMLQDGLAEGLGETVQQLLVERLLSPAACAEIQRDLTGINLLGPLLTGLQVERADMMELLDRYRDDPGHVVSLSKRWNAIGPGIPPSLGATNYSATQMLAQMQRTIRDITSNEYTAPSFFALLSVHGWVDQNKARIVRAYQMQLDGMDADHRRVDSIQINGRSKELMAEIVGMTTGYNYLLQVMAQNHASLFERCAMSQTRLDEALVACALERFHAAHGHYPESLGELVPAFAERLPHDLFDGKPLRYRRAEPGYLLYSIGWNAVDDGGKLNRRLGWSETDGDWVWEAVPKR